MNIDGNFPTYEQQQQTLSLLQEIGVDIDTLLAGRVVKSVQRGIVNMGGTGGTAVTQTINLSQINPTKSDVTLQGSAGIGGTSYLPYVIGLTSTSLSVKIDNSNKHDISWQVVEFY